MGRRSNIQIEFSVKPQAFPRLASENETVIFRLIQESLTNVCRHSGSGRAQVELEKQTESALIRVRDYGRGISEEATEEISPALGVGIAGMRERVKQLGGVLTVRACKPGTLVEASVPVIPRYAS